MTKRQKEARGRMVLAMDYVARQINDEEVLDVWFMGGVPNEELTNETTWDDENVQWYCEDEERFAELMDCFLRAMKGAAKSGGLYCGDVVSNIG